MHKGKLNIPVISVLIGIILIGGLGFYLLTNSSDSGSKELEAVKNTESFQKLQQEGEVQVKTYNITRETVSFSQENDPPYNQSTNSIEDRRSTFTLATDFADFNQIESRMVLANNSRSTYIYQLEDGEVTNTVSGMELVKKVNQKEMEQEKQEACRTSEITVKEASVQDEQLSVNVSNTNGELARWVYVNVTTGGDKLKENEVIGQGESFEFMFEEIDTENIEQINLNSKKCGYRETINQLPVE